MAEGDQLADTNIWAFCSHIKAPRLTWGRTCGFCGITLLSGENRGFCCGKNGKYLASVPKLPPFSPELQWLSRQDGISGLSRKLNLVFSFAAMETTGRFSRPPGPDGFLSIEGRVYHRLRPDIAGTGLRWVLYDGYDTRVMPGVAYSLPRSWIHSVRSTLIRNNPFVRQFLMLRNIPVDECPNHFIALDGNGVVGEVAAIIRYDNTAIGSINPRNLIVSKGNGRKVQIPTISKLWEPLVYPLFFEYGTLGWGVTGESLLGYNYDDTHDDDTASNSTQIWHYRAMLLREERFEIFGRLANEYLVDMWTRELEARFHYVQSNIEHRQQQDAELMDVNLVDLLPRENVYLPASFVGSILWSSENVSDALALAAQFGSPTFFVTVTCNPNWPEITCRLRPGQAFHDIPVVVARVFKQKFKAVMDAICTMFPNAGKILYKLHVIEFQKRGLPHAHILIKFENECVYTSDIDQVISAEMPDNEEDALLVREFMMHFHNNNRNTNGDIVLKSCQKLTSSGRLQCRFRYPHQLQPNTTIDSEGRVHYRRRKSGDQWVVPYCIRLLRLFHCHINFEAANTSHIFQYLFKYVHKGGDRARFQILADDVINEVESFWTGRYLSAGEAAWRVLGNHITRKTPAVTSLPVHLPDSNKHHQYARKSGENSTLSLLDRYFLRLSGWFHDRQGIAIAFDDLYYEEYYTKFRLTKYDEALLEKDNHYGERLPPAGQIRQISILRHPDHPHICRLQSIRPSKGEVYYLRSLLAVRAGRSFQEFKIFNEEVYGTFQEAAHAMGLFADKSECISAFNEAISALKTPHQLRHLFIHMLVNECISVPIDFWRQFSVQLSYDYFLRANRNSFVAESKCLEVLSRNLEEYGLSLADYGLPSLLAAEGEVFHELAKWSPMLQDLEEEASSARMFMTHEQAALFDTIVDAVSNAESLLIFLDGKAGTGKTYVVRAICSYLRAREKIVIATATSAFAAQMYDGGRTTHSTFKVPVNDLNELLKSDIKFDSQRARLLRVASLIIWDEAPMANKAVLDCVDAALRMVMDLDEPFGGKVVILSGDFRQTCPVVRNGMRQDIVEASIKSSHVWSKFIIYKFNIPIRQSEDSEFSNYLDQIGNGLDLEIPLLFLIACHSQEELTNFVFPAQIINDPVACVTRSILAPTNRQIDNYNMEILRQVEGQSRIYLSADTIKEAEGAFILIPDAYLDYHKQHTPPGLPHHRLQIKVNGVYRLMRNLSVDKGLVKNCRVVITGIGNNLIAVNLIQNKFLSEEEILLPRIIFTYNIPGSGFTLYRRQFPLAPAYATTFNSCQGLTLDKVGIDLTIPVFSHGQLYTAFSRIRKREDGMLYVRQFMTTTSNITFHELLDP